MLQVMLLLNHTIGQLPAHYTVKPSAHLGLGLGQRLSPPLSLSLSLFDAIFTATV